MFFEFLKPNQIKVEGWLKTQLQTQANGATYLRITEMKKI